MGFESFRVELRGGLATHAQADEAVRQHPHAKPDPGALAVPGATYYTVSDGRHVFEVEVADHPVRISCRVTLCHPPSAGPALLELVRGWMERPGMEAWVCDDVPPEQTRGYSLADFPAFAEVAVRCLAARRGEWAANFGPVQVAATSPEVYERFILPRCQPMAG